MELSHRQRNYLIFGGIYAVLSVILFLVVEFTDIPSSVRDGYWPYADAMYDWVFPYTEDVYAYDEWRSWEYPPLAYLFIFIPRLFSWSVSSYHAAYIVMTFLFFMLGLWCSERIAAINAWPRTRVMALYSILMFLMFEFLADRYDIIPAVLTMYVIVAVMERKHDLAFFVLALATLTKLYPAVVFPVLLIYLWGKRDKMGVLRGFLIYCGTGLLVLLAFYAMGADPLSFLTYHTDRPLEIEAAVASIPEVLDMLGLTDVWVDFDFGSDNLYGDMAEALGDIMLPLMAVVLILLYAHYFYWSACKKRRDERKVPMDTLLVSQISLMTFVLVSTVFSSQYLIWLIPLMVILMYQWTRDGDEERRSDNYVTWFIAVEVLTQLNFLVNFGFRGEGEDLSNLGIIILLIRNLAAVGIYLGLTWELIKRDRFPERV
ncbi:MAG: glycosyltransferase 87 family protein [Methanomethylophilus sp.]